MNMRSQTVFGTRSMLATILAIAAVCSSAQEVPEEAALLEPAVDTSAGWEPAIVAPDTADSAAGPAPDAAAAEAPPVLAAGVTRQQSGGQVMDRIELGRTEITGNQELPKVLYIVPWRKSAPGELMGRPVNTLLDEVLAPLDREEFTRQVEYHGDLYGDE